MEPRPPKPPNSTTNPPTALPVSSVTGDTASGSHTAHGAQAPKIIPQEPQPGDVIGPYRVLGELGRGGMAAVYLAEEPELSRQVALKVLLPAMLAADPDSKARFTREARAQAAVEHKHVVTIYRVGEDRGLSFLAMPVLKGQTLAKAIHSGARLPAADVLRIGAEIAEGLAAAHEKGLVHRDIKPGNIWLEVPRRWVKILDFGLARDPEATDSQITVSGRIVGTPAYMSPEQAAGKPVDHRTDLFSLGVVLYQMATGQKPFTGETSLEVMAAILTAEPHPPAAVAPDVPPALSGLIMRLLAKLPSGRPQSAVAVAVELDSIKTALAAPPPAPVPQPAVTRPDTPDPWSNLDQTDEDDEKPAPVARSSSRHAKLADDSHRKPKKEESRRHRRDDDEEDEDDRPRATRRPAEPPSLKWLWITLGGLGAVVLLSGVVWLAVSALSPKSKPTELVKEKEKEKEQPRPPVTPPRKEKDKEKDLENDRAAVVMLAPRAALKLQLDGGPESITLSPGEPVPGTGRLVITEIDFGDDLKLPPTYIGSTFIPAMTGLKSLREIRMNRWQLELTADELRLLATMPLANTLTRFDGQFPLSADTLPDVKRFKSLVDATFYSPAPDDATFAQLAADLPQLKVLTFLDLPAGESLTDRGWKAVAKMPNLQTLSLVRCAPAGDAFRVFTAKGATARPGAPGLEFQGGKGVDDKALLELSERPTDLKILAFRGKTVSDQGIKHLAKVKSLRRLILQDSRVSEEAVGELQEALPGVEVHLEGKVFPAKKKP